MAEKFSLGASMAGIAVSGATVIVGAPTVIASAVAIGGFVAAVAGTIASLLALAKCLRDNGRESEAAKIERKVAALQAQVDRWEAASRGSGPIAGDDGF